MAWARDRLSGRGRPRAIDAIVAFCATDWRAELPGAASLSAFDVRAIELFIAVNHRRTICVSGRGRGRELLRPRLDLVDRQGARWCTVNTVPPTEQRRRSPRVFAGAALLASVSQLLISSACTPRDEACEPDDVPLAGAVNGRFDAQHRMLAFLHAGSEGEDRYQRATLLVPSDWSCGNSPSGTCARGAGYDAGAGTKRDRSQEVDHDEQAGSSEFILRDLRLVLNHSAHDDSDTSTSSSSSTSEANGMKLHATGEHVDTDTSTPTVEENPPNTLHFTGSGHWFIYHHNSHLHSQRLRDQHGWLSSDERKNNDEIHGFDEIQELSGTLRSGDWAIVRTHRGGMPAIAAMDVSYAARDTRVFNATKNAKKIPLHPIAYGHQVIVAVHKTVSSGPSASAAPVDELFLLPVVEQPQRPGSGSDVGDVAPDTIQHEAVGISASIVSAQFSQVVVVSQFDQRLSTWVDSHILAMTGDSTQSGSSIHIFTLPASFEADQLGSIGASVERVDGRIMPLRNDGQLAGLSAVSARGTHFAFISGGSDVQLYDLENRDKCRLHADGGGFDYTFAAFSPSDLLFAESLHDHASIDLNAASPRPTGARAVYALNYYEHLRDTISLVVPKGGYESIVAAPSLGPQDAAAPWLLAVDDRNRAVALTTTGATVLTHRKDDSDDDEGEPVDLRTGMTVLGSAINGITVLGHSANPDVENSRGTGGGVRHRLASVGITEAGDDAVELLSASLRDEFGQSTSLSLESTSHDPVCLAAGASSWPYRCGDYEPLRPGTDNSSADSTAEDY